MVICRWPWCIFHLHVIAKDQTCLLLPARRWLVNGRINCLDWGLWSNPMADTSGTHQWRWTGLLASSTSPPTEVCRIVNRQNCRKHGASQYRSLGTDFTVQSRNEAYKNNDMYDFFSLGAISTFVPHLKISGRSAPLAETWGNGDDPPGGPSPSLPVVLGPTRAYV